MGVTPMAAALAAPIPNTAPEPKQEYLSTSLGQTQNTGDFLNCSSKHTHKITKKTCINKHVDPDRISE